MKNIIIDKKFFDLKTSESDGLISGLKNLSERNYKLVVNDFILEEDEKISAILNSERINIFDNPNHDFSSTISVSLSGRKSRNVIVVNKKRNVKNFGQAVKEILSSSRKSIRIRKSKETNVRVKVNLDGVGKSKINSGIGFFDHMLEQISRHGNIDLEIKVKGDLHVDEHHTIEDVGITLGEAIYKALGDKKGIKRYGFALPMDESIALCAIDFGGRPYLSFNAKFKREKIGEFPTELTAEFFKGLSMGMKTNIYTKAKGDNDHHKIESIFKAFAKALNEACRLDERNINTIPSTKGLL